MSQTPKITAIVPVLKVTDVAEAVAFYTQTLGFGNEWTMADFYGSAQRDGLNIHFSRAEANTATTVYFFVEGVDELWAEFAPKGIEVVSPLTSQEYGMRDFYIRDVFGNVLGFGQEIAS